MELTYKTKRCSKLTDEEFEQCSALFSGHYGKYSGKGDKPKGQIKSGYEWLAFTFASQEMYYDSGKLEKFLEFSELQLKEAYERMNMTDQPWTHGTDKELDFVESFIEWGKDSEILDLGCGQGRHSIELYKRGYENISGVDFSEQNIKKASALAREHSTFPMFMCADARKLKLGRKFDVVLCLFDVIGSFRSEDDNMRILKTIRHHLKKGGKAIVSVMNMELTEHIAIHRVSLKEFPQEILKLPPSDTMSRSGDIFKPEHFLINTDDGLVYRKEQFTDDDMISAEYLVADKRYYMSEFESFVKKAGFVVKEKRFVQAGHFERPLSSTDSRAKEILFVLAIE